MALLDHNQYPYRRTVNITAWATQITTCLATLCLFSYVLSLTRKYDFNVYMIEAGYSSGTNWDRLLTAGSGTRIATSLVIIALNIAEAYLVTGGRMDPGLYLGSASTKSLIFGILFIADLVYLDWIGVIVDVVCLVTALTQVIFGARLIQSKRKGVFGPYGARAGGILDPENSHHRNEKSQGPSGQSTPPFEGSSGAPSQNGDEGQQQQQVSSFDGR